jgi:hypothetical protein
MKERTEEEFLRFLDDIEGIIFISQEISRKFCIYYDDESFEDIC